MSIKKLFPQKLKNKYHLWQSNWANIRYGFPSGNMKVIGVTGTDGKTTTCFMIYEILRNAGIKTGLISSVSIKINDKEYESGLHVTTPDPGKIPQILKQMLEEGVKWVVLEVTSHALDQNRIANINFEKAVFTNITNEHLDYHRTWKNLALAKTKLLNMVKEGGEVIFKEDERGGKFIKKMISKNKKVLLQSICRDELVSKKEVTREYLKFNYDIKKKSTEIIIPIIGEYNISNAQYAIKTCESIVKTENIINALGRFKGVEGRMQVIKRKRPCLIIVDFAHTPNALKKALKTIKSITISGKVILVFGCAGLRDRKKRDDMGYIASKFADVIMITSEDPRTEKLKKINDKILEGALKNKKAKFIKRFKNRNEYRLISISKIKKLVDKRFLKKRKSIFIFDQEKPKSREDAIELATRISKGDDTIITTGKGHEKSLCFGLNEYVWSEKQAIERALERRKKFQKVK